MFFTSPRRGGLFESGAWSDICLHTDKRFYSFLLGALVKLNRSEHITVIGQRDSRHIKIRCCVHERLNFTRSVKQTIIRMIVQMNEITHIVPRYIDINPISMSAFKIVLSLFRFTLSEFLRADIMVYTKTRSTPTKTTIK